jgi:tryptophan 2,3-dioxygenase
VNVCPASLNFVGAEKNPDKSPVKNNSSLVSYNDYLKVDDLISLQRPLSSPVAHDEMLFIVIHQTYELWFKQVIFEMESIVGLVMRDELMYGFRLLDRVSEIFRVLIQQVDILETMTPPEFNRFRANLNPASGFQSVQFRELEILAGADPKDYTRLAELNPEWKGRLKNRMENITMRHALFHLLKVRGLLTSSDEPSIQKALVTIYKQSGYDTLYTLCEHLINFDEQFSLWRFRHVQMVERMIGMSRGTGGSLGVPYLQATLKKRFFPELWEVRTVIGSN